MLHDRGKGRFTFVQLKTMKKRKNDNMVTVVGKISDLLLPKAKDACLVMLYGPDLGKRYTVGDHPLHIGRSENSTIYIDRESISRNHAQIFEENGQYIIQDNGSTNGTYVNDIPIQSAVLKDSDLIKIGEVIFKFLSRDNLENVYHEEIYRLATTDGLTMVYNKRYFLDCIDREFSRSMRHNRALSLILLDIDHFKRLNDTYGHLAGDFVLKQTARMIQDKIRFEDIFCRYGGEEFALLLPETEAWQALRIAEKIRQFIEIQQIEFGGHLIHTTASLGTSSTHHHMTHADQLIQAADQCLYQAKTQGRNRVFGYQPVAT